MAAKTLPDRVKIDKKRFDRIQNKVKMFKNKNKFVLPGGVVIVLNANIENGKITHEEASNKIFRIHNDIERLKGLEEINQNQVDMLTDLSM